MRLEFSPEIFENSSNMKFYEKAFSGRRDVSCGQTDKWTDMTKLIVAFHKLAELPYFLTYLLTPWC